MHTYYVVYTYGDLQCGAQIRMYLMVQDEFTKKLLIYDFASSAVSYGPVCPNHSCLKPSVNLHVFKDAGDFANVAFWVLKPRCPEKGSLTVEEVNEALNGVATNNAKKNKDGVRKVGCVFLHIYISVYHNV